MRLETKALFTYLVIAMVGAIVGGSIAALAAPRFFAAGRLRGPVGIRIDVPPATTSPESPAIHVSNRAGPAVVGIVNKSTAVDIFGRQVTRSSSGSGVIFATNGYIVTNNHVVDGAVSLSVSLANGLTYDGVLVGVDAATDLAVVKIDAQNLPAAELGNSSDIRVGEVVIAIGNPVGAEFQRSVTQGIVSGLDRVLRVGDQSYQLIQTDTVINPGNSGGPLCNIRGQVVGINTLKLNVSNVEGMGFAIPINIARPILQDLIASGKVARAYIGIRMIDKANAQAFGITLESGVYISEVLKDGPAERAGLKEKDVILGINGKSIGGIDDLRIALYQTRAGEKVELRIKRDAEEMKVTVTLAEVPAPSQSR